MRIEMVSTVEISSVDRKLLRGLPIIPPMPAVMKLTVIGDGCTP